jgi:ribulose-5-phosphate 4-epimerase/fuculose-1-phosphate aldolase
MKVMESNAVKHLSFLFNEGYRKNWHGVAGDSVSRWLTSPEVLELQAELDLSRPYFPIHVKEPRLARECFLFCFHGDLLPGRATDRAMVSYLILQVNDEGDKCRVLWESNQGERNRPPMELAIHFTSHAAHSVGPGCVVYHCQPLNTLALAAVIGNDEKKFLNALLSGYAAIHNMLPDGIGMLPWQMSRPQRRGVQMSADQLDDMRRFMAEIRKSICHQESLVLLGEGIVVASRSERSVHAIINSIERAATIRLQMMLAGVR